MGGVWDLSNGSAACGTGAQEFEPCPFQFGGVGRANDQVVGEFALDHVVGFDAPIRVALGEDPAAENGRLVPEAEGGLQALRVHGDTHARNAPEVEWNRIG